MGSERSEYRYFVSDIDVTAAISAELQQQKRPLPLIENYAAVFCTKTNCGHRIALGKDIFCSSSDFYNAAQMGDSKFCPLTPGKEEDKRPENYQEPLLSGPRETSQPRIQKKDRREPLKSLDDLPGTLGAHHPHQHHGQDRREGHSRDSSRR